MPGAFLQNDLSAYFDVDEFATAGVFDGATEEVPGILDTAFDLAQLGLAEIGSIAPAFVLASADVPANVRGRYIRFGNLLAGGSRYRVTADHANGSGMTVLQLQDA